MAASVSRLYALVIFQVSPVSILTLSPWMSLILFILTMQLAEMRANAASPCSFSNELRLPWATMGLSLPRW